jgi:hypothetical protein
MGKYGLSRVRVRVAAPRVRVRVPALRVRVRVRVRVPTFRVRVRVLTSRIQIQRKSHSKRHFGTRLLRNMCSRPLHHGYRVYINALLHKVEGRKLVICFIFERQKYVRGHTLI